jgi:hypothetical protein
VGQVSELLATIIQEYLSVDVTVYYKKSNEEQTGKGHLKLFTDRSAEIVFPGHIELI